jgi:hypothetical protein
MLGSLLTQCIAESRDYTEPYRNFIIEADEGRRRSAAVEGFRLLSAAWRRPASLEVGSYVVLIYTILMAVDELNKNKSRISPVSSERLSVRWLTEVRLVCVLALHALLKEQAFYLIYS